MVEANRMQAGDSSARSTVNSELCQEVIGFLYEEARLQDDHEYDAWEALWTDDAIYWVPANGANIDPENEMSIIFDNRSRIGLRIRQLHTGKRHSQEPRSRIRRIVSNIEVDLLGNGDIEARSNSLVFESNLRGEQLWSCRNTFLLRRESGALKMARKKVVLTNNDKPLYTLAFLI